MNQSVDRKQMASSTVSNETLMKELFRGVGPALRDTNKACKASQGWQEPGAFATPRPEGPRRENGAWNQKGAHSYRRRVLENSWALR